jgi:hypothetical protein
MRRLATAAALVILIAAPTAALADGDPASDVLLGQDVFLPYAPISPTAQRQVYAVAASAHAAGYPLKVALIGAKSDLGVVPALFDKPGQYARFLSTELTGVVRSPVLVVMPNGFGLATQGNADPVGSLAAIHIGAGTDGLATAAIAATERLAADAGHRLPANAASAQAPSLGASTSTVRHSIVALVILGLLAAVALTVAIVARARRATAPSGS